MPGSICAGGVWQAHQGRSPPPNCGARLGCVCRLGPGSGFRKSDLVLHCGSHCGAGLHRSVPDDLAVCSPQGRFSSQDQFKVLHERYPLVSNSTKGLLLSTYLKMLLADPSNSGLQGDVTGVFSKCSHQMDPDLQQRSAEYLVRTGRGRGGNMHGVTCHALALLLRCHTGVR